MDLSKGNGGRRKWGGRDSIVLFCLFGLLVKRREKAIVGELVLLW